MPKAKQLTVWTESAPGEIGRVARALTKVKVNVTAFSCQSLTGLSPIRMQVSEHTKARRALLQLGLRITEEEVLRLTVADRPGALAEIGVKLGEAGINIEYAYGAVAATSRRADLVFGVSDLSGALRILRPLKLG